MFLFWQRKLPKLIRMHIEAYSLDTAIVARGRARRQREMLERHSPVALPGRCAGEALLCYRPNLLFLLQALSISLD